MFWHNNISIICNGNPLELCGEQCSDVSTNIAYGVQFKCLVSSEYLLHAYTGNHLWPQGYFQSLVWWVSISQTSMLLGTRWADHFPLLVSGFSFLDNNISSLTVLLILPPSTHTMLINFTYKWFLFRYLGRDFACVFMYLTRQLFCFQEIEFSHMRNENNLDSP